jgi:hypothetical protein
MDDPGTWPSVGAEAGSECVAPKPGPSGPTPSTVDASVEPDQGGANPDSGPTVRATRIRIVPTPPATAMARNQVVRRLRTGVGAGGRGRARVSSQESSGNGTGKRRRRNSGRREARRTRRCVLMGTFVDNCRLPPEAHARRVQRSVNWCPGARTRPTNEPAQCLRRTKWPSNYRQKWAEDRPAPIAD